MCVNQVNEVFIHIFDGNIMCVCASDTIIASIVGLLVRQSSYNAMHALVQMKRHCLTLKPFCREKFIAHHYYIEVTNGARKKIGEK